MTQRSETSPVGIPVPRPSRADGGALDGSVVVGGRCERVPVERGWPLFRSVRAWDRYGYGSVVLWQVRSELLRGDRVRAHFVEAVRRARSLAGPGIRRVLDAGTHEAMTYVVVDAEEGPTLAER